MTEELLPIGQPIPVPVRGAKWERDLQWFDGPLLSLFVDHQAKETKYLFHWVDCDEKRNRWLVVETDEHTVVSLLAKTVSLHSALTQRPAWAFLVDINEEGEFERAFLASIEQIPSTYLPDPLATLDLTMVPHPEGPTATYSILLEKSPAFGLAQHKDIPTAFFDVYAFAHMETDGMFPLSEQTPFRGGFSTAWMYTHLRRIAESEIDISRYQYASPGLLQITGRLDVLELTWRSYRSNEHRFEECKGLVKQILDYCKEHSLNDEEQHQHVPTFHLDWLAPRGIALADALITPSWRWLSASGLNSFQACKVLIGHHRRLKKLLDMERSGLIRMTEVL